MRPCWASACGNAMQVAVRNCCAVSGHVARVPNRSTTRGLCGVRSRYGDCLAGGTLTLRGRSRTIFIFSRRAMHGGRSARSPSSARGPGPLPWTAPQTARSQQHKARARGRQPFGQSGPRRSRHTGVLSAWECYYRLVDEPPHDNAGSTLTSSTRPLAGAARRGPGVLQSQFGVRPMPGKAKHASTSSIHMGANCRSMPPPSPLDTPVVDRGDDVSFGSVHAVTRDLLCTRTGGARRGDDVTTKH